MKAVLALFALVCIGSAVAIKPLAAEEYQFLFKNWMNQHSKAYHTTSEFETRYSIWRANLDKIRKHEANPSRTHTMAMNKFGDLTQQEFKEMYCTLSPISNNFMRSKNVVMLNTSVPDSIDWVKAKKVTKVKDQGQCGSCWSFSATGSIESGYAVDQSTDATILISEQELVDCSGPQGNQGCNGGLMDQAFEFVIANGGLCTESDYPYKAVDGQCPNPLTCKSALTIAAFVDVAVNNEDQLQAAVASRPVSVAVDAETWQFYSGGVLTSSCGTSLDHGVLAAGYGTDNGQAYWLVKNSWGGSWGESGYIRLARGSGSGQPGQCGICMAASYPTGVTVPSSKRHHRHH